LPRKEGVKIMKRVLILASAIALAACSSTQKTEGVGFISGTTQSVLTIAGNAAIVDADFALLNGKLVALNFTGFVEERNRGFIDNLVSRRIEDNGGIVARSGRSDMNVEVIVNRAGNDQGSSNIPIIQTARRTEAVVDLTIVIRDTVSGKRLAVQTVRGEGKYEQARWVGIQARGKYFVKKYRPTGEILGSNINRGLVNEGWEEIEPR
jgi:hypothetical protein